jgi:tRNA A-37 threonylcarbamoyl transferase component Bud32
LAALQALAMDALAPGRELGKYRVVRRLATGGMAEIYLAEARGIEGFAKHVVLKCILPQYAASETFVRLFINEARVTASLDHPNIAAVYDIGEHQGTYFFAMEYLHGEDLGRILRQLHANSARLPLEHALTIGAGVAAGLHAAHEKRGVDGRPLGLVHRDVSPSNVVVTYDGGVKLVDFGVAKLTAQSEATHTGTLKGKVAYMSPEQCNDQPLDRRSDVFSLAVLIYELTTLTRLFRAESEAATLRLVLTGDIPPPSSRVSDYPPELEAVLLRALSRDRNARHATARELQIALEQVARSRGLVISPAGLGDWINDLFGRKAGGLCAPGETLGNAPAVPTPSAQPAVAMGDPSSAPRRLDRGPVLQPLPGGDDPVGGDRTPLPVVAAAGRTFIARSWPLVAIAVLSAGLALLIRPSSVPSPVAATAAPAVISAPPPAVQPATPPAPPVVNATPAALAVPPATAAAQVPPAPASLARKPPARKIAAGAPADRFRAAFARKEAALLACFARFGDPGEDAPEISIRFHADEDGHVVSAELAPPAVEETPLGHCIEELALATEFGPQPSPVAFRIPVSVRRVGTAPEQ